MLLKDLIIFAGQELKYEMLEDGMIFENSPSCQVISSKKGNIMFQNHLNPSYAKATFIRSTMTQRFLKNILTLSCMYLLESSCQVFSDEYQCARVSVNFQGFLHHFILAKLALSSIMVNPFMPVAPKKGLPAVLFCEQAYFGENIKENC